MLNSFRPWRWYTRLKRHYTARAATVSPASAITVATESIVQTVSERYLSFSIDISVLAGGYWWEGSDQSRRGLGALKVPPIHLRGRKLDKLVQGLGPSYLRVGGSEADKIHYFTAPIAEPDSLVLTRKHWDRLHLFLARNQLRLIFTLKYGLFKRSHHGNWDGEEIAALLQYSLDNAYAIDVLELGNELNAYWAFHGLRAQPRAADLASDYDTFARAVRQYYPNVLISGPGSAFWPRLGETIKPFSNITRRFLKELPTSIDIVNWHYYPFQSHRSPVRTRAASVRTMLNPKSFEDFTRYSRALNIWRDQFQPNAAIWTGETGSAQCGGQPKLSDRFISSFWWADQLGQGAMQGQQVMVRQSLVGGDYGLIDRLTLKPRPDYWLSWLWVRLMGQRVYSCQHSDKHLRVYCHEHPNGKLLTLMIVNLKPQGMKVSTSFANPPQATYTLTAKKLTSRKVFINGVRPKLDNELSLNNYPTTAKANKVPGYSISFWCFAKAPPETEV